ncbi:WG repeat-containing protein [Aureibaculum sp. A20]|uniref:WG repeat-containing protein n=1 Tax=Aureibaculum flavum TaxID=2795986 RepID=A0ABS0WLP9_9FLAO|nr:WG repeat-containing protein [Aureibaculum flavum]MBJ2172895.1 WG repeat-containing protein [Aureibaculum flavum]
MKKLIVLLLCFSVNQILFSQNLKDIDFVSPFNEDLAAVQKNDQWAFINKKGEKVIDFRDGVVATEINSEEPSIKYPIFKEGKCIIKKRIDNTFYYGYMDKEGNTIIEPQFLNVTNFKEGIAIIIKIDTTTMGKNKILSKNVVSYNLEEYVIDGSGKIIKYLDNGRGYNDAMNSTSLPPSFHSKIIAPRLIALKTKNEKWNLYSW